MKKIKNSMRVLIKLEAIKDFEYDLKYFHKLQGFFYKLLIGTKFENLHDKKGYKFFCFSNIFPISNFKEGDERNLILSSPSKIFILNMMEKLNEIIKFNKIINIGEMQFRIKGLSPLNIRINKNLKIISATPIIIRIPEKNYEKYNIPENFRKKRYVYWRPQYSFDAFIKQLEENLIKKYNEFYRTNIKIERIFEIFKFKKSIVNHVIINGKEQKLIGSIWEFYFTYVDKQQKKILKFGMDSGFGERNSFGFGFMNIIRGRESE
jgi:CRISPR-associated endoribonuclease Cas6